jgi:hypothetical protein
MSNISVKVAFAFFVVLTYPAASFAQHAGSAATTNVPITTIDRSGRGKCIQGNSATAAAPNRPDRSVCWAPRDTTDGPGV